MLENIQEKEILPKGLEDETIPTQIAKIDEHINFLREQHEVLIRDLACNESERERLIARAKEVRIFEDAAYKIVEIPVYPKKSVDVEALKRLAPDKHSMIVSNLTAKAQDKIKAQLDKIQVFIAQSDVKAVISDKVLLSQIIPEPTTPSRFDISIVKK